MSGNLTIAVARTSYHRAIGKLLLVVAFGAAFGHWVAVRNNARAADARALTLESYTRNFDAYKAAAISNAHSSAIYMFAATGMALLLFGLYELLGRLLGVLIGRAIPMNSAEAKFKGPSLPTERSGT